MVENVTSMRGKVPKNAVPVAWAIPTDDGSGMLSPVFTFTDDGSGRKRVEAATLKDLLAQLP
jgi:hypothetical protein